MKKILAVVGVAAVCLFTSPVVANAAPSVAERPTAQKAPAAQPAAPQPMSDEDMARVVGGQINVPPPTDGGGGTPPPPAVNPLLNALDRLEQTLAARTGRSPDSFVVIERLEAIVTRLINRH